MECELSFSCMIIYIYIWLVIVAKGKKNTPQWHIIITISPPLYYWTTWIITIYILKLREICLPICDGMYNFSSFTLCLFLYQPISYPIWPKNLPIKSYIKTIQDIKYHQIGYRMRWVNSGVWTNTLLNFTLSPVSWLVVECIYFYRTYKPW